MGCRGSRPSNSLNEFHFQPLGDGQAILNAEMTLLPAELNPFIDKIFAGGLVFMAEHQHFSMRTRRRFTSTSVAMALRYSSPVRPSRR